MTAYNLYIGSLVSLHGSGTYDHVEDPGGSVEFPDSPTVNTGCDVSGSTTTTARVRHAAAWSYFLLVAAGDGGCEGPYGERSDGRDRHDSGVDPRPDAGFCP